jgi:hypothetical protein
MSRSNPTANNPNPATRWFEWAGKDGRLFYYDKAKKEKVNIPLPFTFMALDSTKTVRGYNKKLKTGLYANEVKDVQADRLVVKFFNGGTVAEGVWADIRDAVIARSGKFGVNLYIAYKAADGFKIGCNQLTGCAMSAWFDFEKKSGKSIFEKAITITQGKKDTSGDVEFIPPAFALKDVSEETNAAALALDKELQEYFAGYFKRTVADKAKATATADPAVQHSPEDDGRQPEPPDDFDRASNPPAAESDDAPW